MGMVFKTFLHSPDLWVWFFVKKLFIGELFWHFQIYGYDLQKIFRIYGYTFEKFLRIYGWYFYDLNDTTPYIGTSSDPPQDFWTPGEL